MPRRRPEARWRRFAADTEAARWPNRLRTCGRITRAAADLASVAAGGAFFRASAEAARADVAEAGERALDRYVGSWRPRALLAALCCLISSAALAQSPGTIRGRVELQRPPAEIEARPNVAGLGMPAQHGRADRRRSVVYLETAPRGAFETREEGRARIDQRNETFEPRVLAIVAGTTVEFPNSDVTYHNVFSFSKPKSFDLGRYAAGRSRAVRFDQPGIVRVFCDIHSHMSAYVLVFAHRFFAVTDEDGRFRIRNVPPGTYTLVAWNEAAAQESRRVAVTDGGDVEVNFALGRP